MKIHCVIRTFLFLIPFFYLENTLASEDESFSKTCILYIRHGEVPGNDPSPLTYIYTGCGTNDSLTEKGRAQAEKCAKEIFNLQSKGIIGKVHAIYSSDLKRAIETAHPIANELGIEIQPRHNLREINWGSADGQLVQKMTDQWGDAEKKIKEQYPDRKLRWDHLPVFEGAETYNALLKRSLDEIKTIANAHPGETVIIVGHGRVLKTLLTNLVATEGYISYPPNCGIVEFSYCRDEGLRFVKTF